jgi:hypothetical protein
MNLEWLSLIVSMITLIIIAASAFAALGQLRHLRSSNQIAALTEAREAMEAPHFRDAMRFVMRELRDRITDPNLRSKIVSDPSILAIPELEPARMVANFFEALGIFVKYGMIDRDLVCDLWGGLVLRHWEALWPFISNVRIARDGPAIWENFEYLAMLMQEFDDAHPNGAYPRSMKRMPQAELWPELRDQ